MKLFKDMKLFKKKTIRVRGSQLIHKKASKALVALIALISIDTLNEHASLGPTELVGPRDACSLRVSIDN